MFKLEFKPLNGYIVGKQATGKSDMVLSIVL